MNNVFKLSLLLILLTANIGSHQVLAQSAERQNSERKTTYRQAVAEKKRAETQTRATPQPTSQPAIRTSEKPPVTSVPPPPKSTGLGNIPDRTKPLPTSTAPSSSSSKPSTSGNTSAFDPTGKPSAPVHSVLDRRPQNTAPSTTPRPSSSTSPSSHGDTTTFYPADKPIEPISSTLDRTKAAPVPKPPSPVTTPVKPPTNKKPLSVVPIETIKPTTPTKTVMPAKPTKPAPPVSKKPVSLTKPTDPTKTLIIKKETVTRPIVKKTTTPAPVALPRSLGSGSLIGTSIPASASIPIYPKIHDDPESYVADQLILISSDMTQAKQLAKLMTQYQARVIRRRKLTDLNFVLSTFRLSKSSVKQASVKQLLENIRTNHPQVLIAPNYFFYPQSTPSARELNNRNDVFKKINKPQGETCGDNLNVGMLDGPINIEHTSLTAQKIIQENFYAKGEKFASNSHATAIASILVGDPNAKGLNGVISEATLYAGNVMQQHPKDKKKMLATTESLIVGLNWLVSKKVNVINLSLGGKRNLLLELALKRVIEKKIFIVAAAGNGGPTAEPRYPAAMDNVISVTSIDQQGNIAADANQGNYIDIAAPGVDLWVAGKNNSGRYNSGTSMAAPLVTAALSLLVQNKRSVNTLFEQALDLGAVGKDPVFGFGLLQFSDCGG